MAAPKRMTRKTQGLNAEVFVAKAGTVSTDATLSAFISAATLGKLGVYDKDGNRHTDLITSTEEFFFVLKTTEGIKRSNMYKFSEILEKTKRAYIAPVKQVTGVGWYGSGGSLNAETIEKNQTYILKVIETTEGNDPFPTWNYEYTTGPTDTQMDVMQQLAKQINDDNAVQHKQNARLVVAKVKADATYGNFTLTGTTPTLTFTNGSDVVTLGGTGGPTFDMVAGDLLSVDTAATPTDSVGDIYKVASISAGVSFVLNRPWTGATTTFSQAESQGTRIKKVTALQENLVGLSITTLDDNVNFRLAKQEFLADADITYVTAYVKGNGLYYQVLELEKEGRTFAGETTQAAARAEKYGQQDSFTVVDETYDYYQIDVRKGVKGIAPEDSHFERSTIILAVAKSSGTIGATIETLFAIS